MHKRLGTRNILLTSRLVPKIAGFGPTPEEGENEVNKKTGKVSGVGKYKPFSITFYFTVATLVCMFSNNFQKRKPTKWLAPECFESMQNCTSMSDVWAFGVVIWETFSIG